jgi:hypothetical protein
MELISKMIEDQPILKEELKQLKESIRCIMDSDYPMQIILKDKYKKLNKVDKLINKIETKRQCQMNL